MSLPIFFGPLKEETIDSWVYRLAHANCIYPNDIFSSSDRRYPDWSLDRLVIPRPQNISSINEWQRRRSCFPEYFHHYHQAYSCYKSRPEQQKYCPQCLTEEKVVHEKIEWTFPWMYHCPTHNLPLISDCLNCNKPTSIYEFRCLTPFTRPWGLCPHCSTSLAEGHITTKPNEHELYQRKIRPAILEFNVLAKNSYNSITECLHFSLIAKLAELLSSNPKMSHRRYWLYHLLQDMDVFPEEFICCQDHNFNSFWKWPNYIPLESGIALAMHIWSERQDIFIELINEEWVSHLYPIPNTDIWIPDSLIKEFISTDMHDIYAYLYGGDVLHQLFGIFRKGNLITTVKHMIEAGPEALELLNSSFQLAKQTKGHIFVKESVIDQFRFAYNDLALSNKSEMRVTI